MWRFQINQTPLPLRGMMILLVSVTKQIDTAFLELDSGASLYNEARPEYAGSWTVNVQ
jgi:hypothetical protein